ncbi:hypothetical protein [Streptomyces sp. NPDC058255]|uniref:hypothetical protein n=1 Tax=Streptomyces sp. NPDC058255 TaxID=3346407 RepID=UPI0036F0B93A
MSADRETNHDMATHRDIALLLAEAADEVEIGIAPYQAVVRGGRRRKARRWAIAAAAALVIAGSTGTLALAGGPGGDGGRVAPAATQPATAKERHVYAPQRSTLAMGTDHGKNWQVSIDVWGAPRDGSEARRQLDRMREYGAHPPGVRAASDLIGASWFFVHRLVGDTDLTTVMEGEGESLSGTDMQAAAMSFGSGTSAKKGASRLVVGQVAPTAQRVTCTWDDGTTSVARRGLEGDGLLDYREPKILPVKGSRSDWFVCLAPEGKSNRSAKVTK